MSPPYPGSLGSLFSSQGSWEYLRHVSLGPSLFPGKGAISEACLGRDVSGPPCISSLGMSLTCSTFGMRQDSSELSFLLEALGYLSSEDPAPGAISSLDVGYLLVSGRLMLAQRKSLRGRLHAGLLWEGGTVSRPWGSRAGCLPVGRGRLCLLGLSEWGGGPCLSRVLGGGVRGGGFWARRCPHWGRVSLGSCHFPPPRSSREGPPPRPTPRPIPGAASTIPLICNDFCLFLSFSFSDLPPPPPRACAGTAPTPSGSVRFRFVC